MRRLIQAAVMTLAVNTVAGCGSVSRLLGLNTVTITLVNATDFSVDGRLFTNEEKAFAFADIKLLGDEHGFNLAAGESVTLPVMDCDTVQAIEITDADLRIVAGISPSTSTTTLLEGEDFSCGDTLVFTFTNTGLLNDFRINLNRQ